jgi:hypothetical protein
MALSKIPTNMQSPLVLVSSDMPAGTVVQIVDATGNTPTNLTANDTWAATNATVSITPKFTNSKIYLSHTAGGLTDTGGGYGDRGIRIQRAISGGATSLIYSSQRYGYTQTNSWVPINWAVIDVDAGYNTTSQLTYSIEIYKGGTGGNARHCDDATWTFVAMEIAQ